MRTPRRRLTTGLALALLVGLFTPVLGPAQPASASTPIATTTFTLCGPLFSTDYVVPPGVRFLTVNALGAGGQDGDDGTGSSGTGPGGSGGRGARVSGSMLVSPGDVLSVHVGCSSGSSGVAPGGTGGDAESFTNYGEGGNGGGASGVTRGSSPLIIAAGGGGGAGGVAYTGGTIVGGGAGRGGRPTGTGGGSGGQSDGQCVSGGSGGGGASQSSGGSGGARGVKVNSNCSGSYQLGTNGASGSFRQGGAGGRGADGVNWCGGSGAGGGGGGRYGGGGGGGGAEACSAGGGGGGGSSWASSAFSGVSYESGAAANTSGSVTITAWASVPTTLALSPATQTRSPGQSATVTANVRDQDGDPMGGIEVRFERAGVHSGGGSAITNSSGNASHTWTGSTSGQDVVTASVLGTTATGAATVTWSLPPVTTTSIPTPTTTSVPLPTTTTFPLPTTTSIPTPTTTSVPLPTTTSIPVPTTTSIPVPTPGEGFPSDDCSGGTTVADGHAAGLYSRVETHRPDADTLEVCFRLDGAGAHQGGTVTIGSPGIDVPPNPTVDDEADQCASAAGDTDPTPDPLLSGEIGDEADPATHITFLLDTYLSSDELWICTDLDGAARHRVIVPLPNTPTPPTVDVELDEATPHDPGPAPWPEQSSAACANSGTSTDLLNTSIGPTHVWLSTWQESIDRTHVCVRAEGGAGFGGQLTVDTSDVPGVSPVADISIVDTSPCTINVITLGSGSTQTSIRRSPTGDNPASLCLVVGETGIRVTVGTTGSLTAPAVTWTPDADSPG